MPLPCAVRRCRTPVNIPQDAMECSMNDERLVTVGVDTHTDMHVAAVLDQAGRLLGTASFPATTRGYARLATWTESFGQVGKVGMEGTGSFGAGLLRFLADDGLAVIEVDRPDRSARRRNGKSDPLDAESAARAVQSGQAAGTPKSQDAQVEMIRVLRVARRWQALQAEIDDLDAQLTPLVTTAAPELVALPGVGVDTAGQLLVTAGDNAGRLRSERSFARLCGVAPVPVSSGRTDRHRLHRGGDRDANSALWRIVLVRMHCHQPTKDYVARRTADGRTKKEILRCLKRYIAREVFPCLLSGRPASVGGNRR
jgi:transposase